MVWNGNNHYTRVLHKPESHFCRSFDSQQDPKSNIFTEFLSKIPVFDLFLDSFSSPLFTVTIVTQNSRSGPNAQDELNAAVEELSNLSVKVNEELDQTMKEQTQITVSLSLYRKS